MAEGATGFWSYAHDDNDAEGKRIERLAADVAKAYELLTGGDPLKLFLDSASIQWGDDWELRIREALQSTVFFIPIVTPRYFRRPECRKELLAFAGEAESLGLQKLLLPIYYVDVPDFTKDNSDPAIAMVAATQYLKWNETRLEDTDTAVYRKAVNEAAERLVQIAAETEGSSPADQAPPGSDDDGPRPSPVPIIDPSGKPDSGEADPNDASEEDGFLLEQLALWESSMPRVTEIMDSIGSDLKELGAFTEEATAELEQSTSFAERLAGANRLAKRLTPIAARIQSGSAEFVSTLLDMDPGMLTMLRLVSEDSGDEEAAAEEFYESVIGLADVSRESVKNANELAQTLDSNASFSRELRKPLHQIRDAMRDLADGQTVIEGWAKRASDLSGDSG